MSENLHADEFMGEHSHRLLKDVAEIVMGQSPPGATVSPDVGFPLLNGPTEFGSHCPSPVQFTTDPKRFAREGDILFCVRGSTTGRMNWADRDYAIGRGVAAVRYKNAPHLQHFIRGVIEHELPSLLVQATGSTFPNLSREHLYAVPLPDIPLEAQERVSSILKVFDDRIDLNRRMCETLEEMAQTLFTSWFVDFEPVRAKIEDRWKDGESLPGLPAHVYELFPNHLVDSKLGLVPQSWHVVSLDETADHLRDTTDPGRSPEREYTLYSIPAFDLGMNPESAHGRDIRSNKCIVKPGTVLLSRLNPDIERVWFVGKQVGDLAIASTEFAVLRAKPPIDSSFLYCTLRSDDFHNRLVGLVTGTSKSHQRVRPRALASMSVLLPSKEVLAKFSSLASPWLEQILALRRSSQHLTALRDTMLPKLISGEVHLPHVSEVTEC